MKSTLVNMVLSLGIITVVAAAALAGVYSMTMEPIAQAKAQKQQDAIGQVLPGIEFNNNPAEELGTEPGSSARAASTLSYCAPSPAL